MKYLLLRLSTAFSLLRMKFKILSVLITFIIIIIIMEVIMV